MREQPFDGLSLFGRSGNRKYLNAAERHRFVQAASCAPAKVRLFCLTLRWSGARISEVLALTAASIDIESGVASIESLKRRRRGIFRQVPLPSQLVKQLRGHFQVRRRQRDPDLASVRLWRWSRTTAWRHVKAIMAAAGITGTQAMPKGLRHGFGVNAFQSNVPPHLVQRWLGHASLRTTGIYADVIGPDERGFAARMWEAPVGRPRARRRGSGETNEWRERGHRFHAELEKHRRSKERGGQHVRQIS
jgi:integrase/recombinase XerD